MNLTAGWLLQPLQIPDATCIEQARARQNQLTKPPGSLGLLEEIAVRLCGLQKTAKPQLERLHVTVFAADHGIAAEQVSAFPQAVTAEMVKNFVRGGAAVNVLSRLLNAQFDVVDVGLIAVLDLAGVIVQRAGSGTANFSRQAAMNHAQLAIALDAGRAAVERAVAQQAQLFIGGEMGIANTASASAMAAALLKIDAAELTGAGTGLNLAQIEHKTQVIERALALHQPQLNSPLAILQQLGGFEIAALVGALIAAGQCGLPVLVDGFITSVAALCAVQIQPGLAEWLMFGHCSQEKGHRRVLEAFNARPLLNLDMRLGEASGALTAVPLLQMACALHNQMATFAEAGISGA